MSLHRFVAILGAAILLGAAPAKPAGAPVVINASIPLSGPAAFLGKSLVDAFHAIEIVVNDEGGIHGLR